MSFDSRAGVHGRMVEGGERSEETDTAIGVIRGPFRGWETTEDLVPFMVEAFGRLLEFESGLRT